MNLQIKRKDGSVVEIHDGAMRVNTQIQVYGKAEIIDPKTGATFQVARLADGSIAEAELPTTQ